MRKKNSIKITREKTLETIEKELHEAMNILDDINMRINEALKTEHSPKENSTDSQNSFSQPDTQPQTAT